MKKIFELMYRFFPIKKNTVLFDSFHGNYSCNPKYISEKLHEFSPKTKIIWAAKEQPSNDFPDYVELVEYGTTEYFKYYYTSSVRVDNYIGEIRNILGPTISKFFSKRSKQLVVATWHGKPFKKIGLDAPETAGNKKHLVYSCADVVINASAYMKECYIKALLKNHIPFISTGYPRNDLLLEDKSRSSLKDKLGLPKDKKILLYAPSFRESIERSGVEQLKSFDIDKLFEALSEKFGGEWVIVFRAHNLVAERVNEENLYSERKDILNGNLHDDMAEYLACADVFITDHSSSIMDVMLCDTPSILYMYNMDELEDERGFYFSMEALPYPKAYDFEELLHAIEFYNKELCESQRKQFLADTGDFDDGKAAERVAAGILDFLEGKGLDRLLAYDK